MLKVFSQSLRALKFGGVAETWTVASSVEKKFSLRWRKKIVWCSNQVSNNATELQRLGSTKYWKHPKWCKILIYSSYWSNSSQYRKASCLRPIHPRLVKDLIHTKSSVRFLNWQTTKLFKSRINLIARFFWLFCSCYLSDRSRRRACDSFLTWQH